MWCDYSPIPLFKWWLNQIVIEFRIWLCNHILHKGIGYDYSCILSLQSLYVCKSGPMVNLNLVYPIYIHWESHWLLWEMKLFITFMASLWLKLWYWLSNWILRWYINLITDPCPFYNANSFNSLSKKGPVCYCYIFKSNNKNMISTTTSIYGEPLGPWFRIRYITARRWLILLPPMETYFKLGINGYSMTKQ